MIVPKYTWPPQRSFFGQGLKYGYMGTVLKRLQHDCLHYGSNWNAGPCWGNHLGGQIPDLGIHRRGPQTCSQHGLRTAKLKIWPWPLNHLPLAWNIFLSRALIRLQVCTRSLDRFGFRPTGIWNFWLAAGDLFRALSGEVRCVAALRAGAVAFAGMAAQCPHRDGRKKQSTIGTISSFCGPISWNSFRPD